MLTKIISLKINYMHLQKQEEKRKSKSNNILPWFMKLI